MTTFEGNIIGKHSISEPDGKKIVGPVPHRPFSVHRTALYTSFFLNKKKTKNADYPPKSQNFWLVLQQIDPLDASALQRDSGFIATPQVSCRAAPSHPHMDPRMHLYQIRCRRACPSAAKNRGWEILDVGRRSRFLRRNASRLPFNPTALISEGGDGRP
jgi:hypothetical protein